jgi:hypothetical protein
MMVPPCRSAGVLRAHERALDVIAPIAFETPIDDARGHTDGMAALTSPTPLAESKWLARVHSCYARPNFPPQNLGARIVHTDRHNSLDHLARTASSHDALRLSQHLDRA